MERDFERIEDSSSRALNLTHDLANGAQRTAPDKPTDVAEGNDAGARDELDADDALGAVRIAPRVLRTVISEAARRVPGVARMAPLTGNLPQLLGRSLPRHGVGVSLHGDEVSVDLYLVVEPSANLLEVGAAVQEAVSAAIEHILGMRARQVNVYIQDVA